MEDNREIEEKTPTKSPCLSYSDFVIITKEIMFVNITNLNLSNYNIGEDCPDIDYPPYLINLKLNNTNLKMVPPGVSRLKHLRQLDLSQNYIEYFDETPSFCHTIETLDVSENSLQRPPYWVWKDSPSNLSELNLRFNMDENCLLDLPDLSEHKKYKSLLTVVNMCNCHLLPQQQSDLLKTLTNVERLDISSDHPKPKPSQSSDFPYDGMRSCVQITTLNCGGIGITKILPSIGTFTGLTQIDLVYNNIVRLPNEFSSLINLEMVNLGYNRLYFLPFDMFKNFKKLKVLSVNCNKLTYFCDVSEMKQLKKLDLYNNYLKKLPGGTRDLEEFDFDLNLKKIDNKRYRKQRETLRNGLVLDPRFDGRKYL